jgi:hypothetical protein
MTNLSSAAQAVLDAFLKTPGEEPMPGWDYGRDIAAALRAAADQVVPKDKYPSSDWTDKDEVRYQLLAIAAELDNTSQPSQ